MARRNLPDETRSYVMVTVERTIRQQKRIGVLVEDVADAEKATLALPKAHNDAGWENVEASETTVVDADHQLGVFDPYEGRLKPAR